MMLYNNYPVPQSPRVYDPKLGYVTPERLRERGIRQDVNRLSLTALTMLVSSFIGGLIIGLFLAFSGGYSGLDFGMSPVLTYALTGFMTVLGTALPFMIYLFVRRNSVVDCLRFEKVGLGYGLLYVLAGTGCCLATNIPAGWIATLLEAVGLHANVGGLVPAEDLPGAILMFVTVAVLPAVFEEFAYRGVVLSVLRKYGDGFAIVVSALIFGMLHMSPIGSFAAVLSGLVFGFLYVKTGNLWITVLIHFLNNAIAVASVFVGGDGLGLINILLLYVPIALGLAAIIILAAKKRLNFQLGRAQTGISTGRKAACAVGNPGFILLVLVFITFCLWTLTGGGGL